MGRKIPLGWVVIVMLFTIAAISFVVLTTPNDYGDAHISLVIGALAAGIVAMAYGYKWKFLENGIIASIGRSMQACLILMIVGMLIGSWLAAGVVPAMIYYGLMILKPSIFLLAGCLLCSIVSLATGSSWTTAGTIGVAIIGIGIGLGFNPAMTAGAVVSGAYFGDKMSPLSDTTNLAPAVAGSTLFEHIRHMIYTVGPSLIIACIIYTILGFGHGGENADMSRVTAMMDTIASSYNINLALLIPPLLVIVIVALKIPAIPGLLAGVLLGCLFGSIFQGINWSDWFNIAHYGTEFAVSDAFTAFDESVGGGLLDMSKDAFAAAATDQGFSAEIVAEYNLASLLTGGGLDSMLWTVSLIICAMTFGGIMDASGMLGTLAEAFLKLAKGVGSLVLITGISCIFINFLAADQYLSIILPGRMYKEAWEDRRLKGKNLSRCLEDCGTMTSSLCPWNTCGATMATFLGVPTFQYAPYAFMNLVNPLVSVFYGYTGITMQKMTEEEYQQILEERKAEKEAAAKAAEA